MYRKFRERIYGKLRAGTGMSLVTVIIVIGFVSVLVSVLMMTSLVNFKMKRVWLHGSKSFYSAEQALDEITVGLQQDVSWVLGNTYNEILANYSDSSRTSSQKDAYMWYKFASFMSGELGQEYDTGIPDPDAPGTTLKSKYNNSYSIERLEAYLKDSTRWDSGEEYGAFVRANGSNPVAGVMEIDQFGDIVLKDVTVYYKNYKGYISIINTDIRLKYPEFVFSNPNVPEITSYAFIADGKVELAAGTGTEIVVSGHTYAGNMEVTGSDVVNTNPTDINQDVHVVKNKLEVKNGSFSTNQNSLLWAGDLETYSGNLRLKGSSYVMDDLNIKGRGSRIKLEGIYNGFGAELNDSDRSSAILVNGAETVLDFSGIDRITLAGHAYLGTKNYGYKDDSTATAENTNKNSIMTGESIAVKGNQLMYLVPAECLWVSDTTGKSAISKNPVSSLELKDIEKRMRDGETFKEVSDKVKVDKLLTDLSMYIAYDKSGNPAAEKLVVKTTGNIRDEDTGISPTYTYYYMSFKDEEAANNYFRDYYRENGASYSDYTGFYLSEIKFPKSLSRITLAGNTLMRADGPNSEEKFRSLGSRDEDNWHNLAKGSANPVFTESYGALYESFRSFCTKLTFNPDSLDNMVESIDDSVYNLNDDRSNKCVFKNLINIEDGSNFRKLTGSTTDNTWKSDDGKIALFYGGDNGSGTYAATPENELIIAYGNVDLSGVTSYKGTIICYGKITGATKEYIASPQEVSRHLLTVATVGSEMIPVASVFRDNEDLAYRISDGDQYGSLKISDLVVYENWTKE